MDAMEVKRHGVRVGCRGVGMVVALLCLSLTTGVMAQSSEWIVYTTENSDLPSNEVIELTVDPGGGLWIGTQWGGLAKLDGATWAVYTTDNSQLLSNTVPAIVYDTRGHLWVGTAQKKGVARFNGETWTTYTPDNSELPWGNVPAIACDAQGTTWIGTDDGGGLARFDGTTWTVYTTENSGLPHNNVLALAVDAQGILWVGTEQGLAKFDGTVWAAYTPENSGLPHGWVWALTPDIQGNLWIGTKDGLAVYREGGVLFPEQATRVEDLVGIWEGRYVDNMTYRQFEADGILKCAMKIEWLQDPSSLNYSGRYWFEKGVLKITDSYYKAYGYGPGVYEVWVRKRDGKAVHLSFHDMGDPAPERADDWSRGMTRVAP